MNYFDIDAISSTDLRYYMEGIDYYRFKKTQEERNKDNAKPVFELGTALHCFILENEKFDERYHQMSTSIDKTTKMGIFIENFLNTGDPEFAYEKSEFKTHKSGDDVIKKIQEDPALFAYLKERAENEGKIFLTADNMKIIKTVYNNCKKNTDAFEMLLNKKYGDYAFETEKIIVNQENNIPIKGKLDLFFYKKGKFLIVDYKTTSSLISEFQNSIKKYRYDIQLAYYGMLLEKEYGCKEDDIKFAIAASETSGACRTKIFSYKSLPYEELKIKIKNMLNRLVSDLEENKNEENILII